MRPLHFGDDVRPWLRQTLHESQGDEQRFREESVNRLQGKYSKLQSRIDAMYLDKFDGRVDAQFFDSKRAEWRLEQERAQESIAEHQRANGTYLNEGVMLLDLARLVG